MARSITVKQVQVHYECSCGHSIVDQLEVKIAFKDLAAVGIRYKKDATTGDRFFLQHVKHECDGTGHYEEE